MGSLENNYFSIGFTHSSGTAALRIQVLFCCEIILYIRSKMQYNKHILKRRQQKLHPERSGIYGQLCNYNRT